MFESDLIFCFPFAVNEDRADPELIYFTYNKIQGKMNDMLRFYTCNRTLFQLKDEYYIKHGFSSLNHLVEIINTIINTSKKFEYEREDILLLHYTFEKPIIVIQNIDRNNLYGNAEFIIRLEILENDLYATITAFGVASHTWKKMKDNSNVVEPLHCFNFK